MKPTFTETAFNSTSDEQYASFTTNERRWITKITKLAAANPDAVTHVIRPEDNDGTLCCWIPKSWLKISPPIKRDYTDEQRAAASARMKNVRQNTNNSIN